MSITGNLELVGKNIYKSLGNRRTGVVTPANVKLVVVTKNQNIEMMQEAIDAGALVIGENRIQEALNKYEILDRQVEWHLIGHLQTNKARRAVDLFDLIHSVDSENLALEIDRAARKLGKRQQILMQLNVSGEDTKYGLQPAKMLQVAAFISNLEHVSLSGIMTIAPYFENAELTRPIFKQTQFLYGELIAANIPNTNIEWLSMGMTSDYEIALEEGANLIRIGTGIFTERRYLC